MKRFRKSLFSIVLAASFLVLAMPIAGYAEGDAVQYTAKFNAASYNLTAATYTMKATITRKDGETLNAEDKEGWTLVDKSGVLEQSGGTSFSGKVASLKVKRVNETSFASGNSTVALVKNGQTYATTTVNYSPSATITTDSSTKMIEEGPEAVTALKINGVPVDIADYVISSDDETAATVEKDGSNVTITPLKAGKASFTVVKASDSSASVKASITFKNAAAKLGDTYYETVDKALKAASSGETVTLANDVTESVSFSGNTPRVDGFEVTIDLNGKTWTGSNSSNPYALRVDYGIVTVKDSVGGGGVHYGSDYAFVVSHLAGNYTSRLVLESGTFTGKTSVVQVGLPGGTGDKKMYYGGELVVNGGTFKTVLDEGETYDSNGHFKYTLNKLDYNAATYPGGKYSESTITVNGGIFENFDPGDNVAEGKGTNFVAEGYVTVNKDGGKYEVVTTIKITFVGSTIDGENVAMPYVVDNIPKGSTLEELFGNGSITWEEIENHFDTKVYSVKNIRVIPKKLKEYSTWSEVLNAFGDMLKKPLIEDTTLYAAMQKYVDKISLSVEKPLCGTEVKNYTEDGKHYQQNAPKITVSESTHMPLKATTGINPQWIEKPSCNSPYVGTMEGGKSYYATVDFYGADFGYVPDKDKLPKVTVENADEGTVEYNAPYNITFAVTADHDWDEGKVTKKATTSATGVKTYTCKSCKATKTESIAKLPDPTKQYGKDGTAVGPGASAAAADKAITSSKSEEGPKGTKFAPVSLRSTKQGKTNINLTWTKVKGAKSYVVYGNACGKKNKMKKIATVKTNKYNVKKAGKKLKKGTYYKLIVVALDSNRNVVSTSKVVHVATKGGKVTNYRGVSIKKSVINKAKKLKRGKTLKLSARQIKQGKGKVKKHRVLSYETSNAKIATVSKKGVVKGKAKGSCYITAYTQSGTYKRIKVTVK